MIEPDGLDKAPTIVGTQTDRVIISAGNSAYVRGIGSSKEDTWYVYRRGGALVDPDTNQTLGYEAIYLGTAQVTRPGDPATIVLTTCGPGSRRRRQARRRQPAASDRATRRTRRERRSTGASCRIYGSAAQIGEAGPQAIITINRGRANGIEVGHVLALYTRGGTVRDMSKPQGAENSTITLPDERARACVCVSRLRPRYPTHWSCTSRGPSALWMWFRRPSSASHRVALTQAAPPA